MKRIKFVPLHERSDTAKTAFANSLFALSTSMVTACLILIISIPITALLKGIEFKDVLKNISDFLTFRETLFIIIFFSIFWFANRLREKAMDILDEVERKKENSSKIITNFNEPLTRDEKQTSKIINTETIDDPA